MLMVPSLAGLILVSAFVPRTYVRGTNVAALGGSVVDHYTSGAKAPNLLASDAALKRRSSTVALTSVVLDNLNLRG
jgi:hypothetical protein